MHCAACGAENPGGARFCGACGTATAAQCPRCGEALAPGLRFCTACGTRLETATGAAAADVAPLEGSAERRRVSVLFVDLENFTALAESLDAEELRSLQARYFEAVRGVVASFGGTVEKFIGDAVMAVWGTPAAHEDDADRAVRAAIALSETVRRLGGAAARQSLVSRAAITSGEAAVTVGAVGHGMVTGDLVNAASRLQAHAPPGGVLVDEATRQLAPDAARYGAVGELELRGRSSAIAAFLATPDADARPGRRRVSHAGPFVGRQRDLDEVLGHFARVVSEHDSRLVSVTGIAGVGKSRLGWELWERLDALPYDVAWHEGRAPAYGEAVTFTAVAEMIRRRLRIPDGAPPEIARRQLAAALGEWIRDEGERRWMEPRIGVLVAEDGLAAYERDELFAAWRRFFERVAESLPTVLVFEDLQWADASLLDFVEHLATWTRNHSILILTLARPELLDRRPTWGSDRARATSLHLERLHDADMRQLLLGRAPDLDEPVVQQVLEHAGGVPLYAVETIRILADRREVDGGPAREPEGHRGDGGIQVPDSLRGLIAARIDALPPGERRLLLVGAVLGRRFRADALAAASGVELSTVRERLTGLLRRELLAVDEEVSSPAHGEIGFVQDLVREVAYHTLTRTERRSVHLAAARHYETRPDDDLAESLAAHLVEAHRIAPDHPDATRIARRAVAALRRAARDALRLHAPQRALAHLEQALRLTDGAEQRAVVLEESAAAARQAAELDLAEQHLREVVEIHASAGRRRDAARARARLASVLLMAQHNDRALNEVESAFRAVRRVESDPAGVELASQLARVRLLMGDAAGGLSWAERALRAARRLGLDALAADVLVTRGTARFRSGDEEGGLEDLRQAIADAERTESLMTELRARNNLAWLLVLDDPRATFETARLALELATSMGVGDVAAQLAEVACAAAIDAGEWDWASAAADDLRRRRTPEANRINVAASLAVIHALRGAADPLRELAALEPFPDETDPQILAGVEYARAWTAFAAGDLAEAYAHASAAADGSVGADQVPHLALAARAALWLRDEGLADRALDRLAKHHVSGRAAQATLATLHAGRAALGRGDGAGEAYRRAADRWRELDLPLHLALCHLDALHLVGAATDRDEVAATVERLGARALERLLARPRGVPVGRPR